jgi:integrase
MTASIGWFLESLSRRGLSSYTVRSYGFALGDFSRWLSAQGMEIEAVSRKEVAEYIAQFAAAAPGGARPAGDTGPIDLATRQPNGLRRSPRTVNHRLSVLSSFFGELIRRDDETGGAWSARANPVPQADESVHHAMTGRDRPPRARRSELRRRAPRSLPRDIDPSLAEQIVAEAGSARDRAILLLLVRTGQRVGDWSDEHGRHGVLGMALGDFDRRRSSIVVLLKGSRDEHRVPVTEDFWPLFDRHLAERGEPPSQAAWLGRRRGQGRPLTYDAFDASLREITKRLGIGRISAHQLRHTLAQQLASTAGLKVTQEILGHRHLSTTADTYAHADQEEMVRALADIATRARVEDRGAGRLRAPNPFVFAYDEVTVAELEAIATPRRLGRDEQ